MDRQPRDVAAGEADMALLRRDLAGDEADEGRFARAVRADHGMEFAVLDVEIDGVGCDDAAEAFGQTLDCKQRISHRAGLGCRPSMPPCT